MAGPNKVQPYLYAIPTGKATGNVVLQSPANVKIQWPNPSGGIRKSPKMSGIVNAIFG